ncbi:MAG: endonuclease III domain-containing protein [Desulfobaccales bacterium]
MKALYDRLLDAFGPQGWWPGETPFEVALGAILTQNTNWQNVARVLENLKARGLLDPFRLYELPAAELAALLRPAGYYNVKAERVRHFLAFLLERAGGSLARLAEEPLEALRPALLTVKGVGPETADSILLYALNKPTFVVDAYTLRVLSRHALVPERLPYEDLRRLFMDHLPPEVPLYQEFHALLVRLGKEFCRPRPRCAGCPAAGWPQLQLRNISGPVIA